ncbi:MAG TPA: hypothetical protein VG477_06180 [Thermoanaerobaculia bacterium]|nr:hypothetical protein [Thermoanaerobaculia bacterium]
MKPKALSLMLALAMVVLAGCGDNVLFDLPSPDGRRTAEVHSHLSINPPAQSLWLRLSRESEPRILNHLEHDTDWCNEIIWSPDSSRVGFLIRGVRLDVYDAAKGDLLESMPLIEPDGYPGTREARSVRFLEDGSGVQFRECVRGGNRCAKVKLWKAARVNRAGEERNRPASAAWSYVHR